MISTAQRVLRFIWANLGHCSFCMRKAFLAASIAWFGVLLLTVALSNWPLLLTITKIAAVGLTMLWFGHLFAFTRKATIVRNEDRTAPLVASPSRRTSMSTVARVLAFGVTWSVAPRFALAGPTLIQCSCLGGKTTSGCCPTDSGNVCNCDDPNNPKIICGQGSVYYGRC